MCGDDHQSGATVDLGQQLIRVPPLYEAREEHPGRTEKRRPEIVSREKHQQKEYAAEEEDGSNVPIECERALEVEHEESPELRSHQHRPVPHWKFVDQRHLPGPPPVIGDREGRMHGRLAQDRRREDVPLVHAVPSRCSEENAGVRAAIVGTDPVEPLVPDADGRSVNFEHGAQGQEDEQGSEERARLPVEPNQLEISGGPVSFSASLLGLWSGRGRRGAGTGRAAAVGSAAGGAWKLGHRRCGHVPPRLTGPFFAPHPVVTPA